MLPLTTWRLVLPGAAASRAVPIGRGWIRPAGTYALLPAGRQSLTGPIHASGASDEKGASDSSNGSEGPNGRPAGLPSGSDLMGDVDVTEIASRLLAKDKKTQESIERIQAARLRVAEAQAAREELQKAMQAEMFEARLEEVQQAQSITEREADAEVKMAQAALLEAQAESIQAAQFEAKWRDALDEEAEKIESIKAGAIAAAAGMVASVPLTTTYGTSSTATVLSTLTVATSSLLLGIVYRYALRQDLGNSQLKGGVVGAFGLVRGLAIADALQSGADGQLSADLVAKGALLAGHSMLEFGFAAVALEFALQRGFLKAFGTATIDMD